MDGRTHTSLSYFRVSPVRMYVCCVEPHTLTRIAPTYTHRHHTTYGLRGVRSVASECPCRVAPPYATSVRSWPEIKIASEGALACTFARSHARSHAARCGKRARVRVHSYRNCPLHNLCVYVNLAGHSRAHSPARAYAASTRSPYRVPFAFSRWVLAGCWPGCWSDC